jgi:hypothetical protein
LQHIEASLVPFAFVFLTVISNPERRGSIVHGQ